MPDKRAHPPVRTKVAAVQPVTTPDHARHTANGVRYFSLGDGYDLVGLKIEIAGYWDVLLGREDPPIDKGILTLMECAEAYHSRAKQIEAEILELEAEGAVVRASRPYKFRTGYLRSFIEATAKTIELGSRRLTQETNELRMTGSTWP